jgi:CheY-like chemotaxis protein
LARKILLADDSVTAQNMGRKILADAGYDVITVNNGSAALKRITEIKPDLIVLDVYMPGYSGLEVCQRLKDTAETAHIPVLLTVGKLEPFKPEEARRVRADAHIIKPFEASELLTAITRLEDRMVPQSEARFSTSVSGLERFGGEERGRKAESGGETDTGWKSRLRFPSKKKKEEPEPEPEEVAEATDFRDFRKKKGKPGNGPAFTVKELAPPGQEPGLVPDIPRDITPEELDALSALAAKLDGPIPEAEDISPLAEKMGPAAAAEVAAAQTAAAKIAAAKIEAALPEPAKIEPAKIEPVKTESAKAEAEAPVPAAAAAIAAGVDAPVPAVESKNVESTPEVEIPVERVEPPSQAAVAGSASSEIDRAETERLPSSEIQARASERTETSAAPVAVNTASLTQEPAPIDKSDEPKFASTVSTIGQTQPEEKIDAKLSEAVAKAESTESPSAEAVAAHKEESKIQEPQILESKVQESKAQESIAEQSKVEDVKPEELKVERIPQPVAASKPEPAEVEEPAPSDEELAEALRMLTPATGHADNATVPSHGTLVAAGQLLAEEVARNAAGGPHWVAEPVALSPEEAAISLEAEMFRIFATTAAAVPVTAHTLAPTAGREGRITGVLAIAAAVENRLAEAEIAATARASAEQPSERHAESAIAEPSIVAAPAEEAKTVPSALSPVGEEIATEVAKKTTIATDEPATEKQEQKDSPATVAEAAPAEEVAAATFADAVGNGNENEDAKTEVQQSREPISATVAETAPTVMAEENQDSSSDSGSEESMGKDGKSGKSNWHQIRTTPTGAGANTNLVEAAKQAEASAEEAPKAMAAAAAAEGSVSGSATDAGTIASIVDSVMADLRPKIVEEIAKKLAGK